MAFLPPVNSSFFIEILSITGGVFWIVVLHQLVKSRRRKLLLNEWYKCLPKNLTKKWCIHLSLENTDIGGSLFTNARPHMDFDGMFRAGL